MSLRHAAAGADDLPETMLRYVIRTRESLILDDASAENLFSLDSYIRQKHCRSILCLPLKIVKPAPGGLTELPTTFTVLKLGQDAVAAVDDLVEMVAAYGYDYRAEAEAGVAAARLTMIIASAMGLVIGLMLAIGFAYSLSKPISMLAKSMLELADGDFNIVLPGLERKDEVGLVTRAVEKFKVLAERRAREEAEAKISPEIVQ